MIVFNQKKYPFKGWDWTELADYFHVEIPENHNITGESQPLVDYIQTHRATCDSYSGEKWPWPAQETIQACRAFLQSIANYDEKERINLSNL